jgi:hypothetical protein
VRGTANGPINSGPSLDVPGWKGVSISVDTGEGNVPTEYDKDGDDLLKEDEERLKVAQEIARKEGDPFGDVPLSFEIIRKRERVLSGYVGQETVSKFTFKNGVVQHRFYWATMTKGKKDSAGHPAIWVNMKTGEDIPTSDGGRAPSRETPPDAELLAFWDAVLASLRPRPGAI